MHLLHLCHTACCRGSVCYTPVQMRLHVARRWILLFVISLLFSAGAGAQSLANASLLAPAPAPQPRETAAVSLLVFPFENTGQNPRVDWVGEAVADLAAERLQDEGRMLRSRAELAAAVKQFGEMGLTFWLPRAEAELARVV